MKPLLSFLLLFLLITVSCSEKNTIKYKTKPLNALVTFEKKKTLRSGKGISYLHSNNSIYALEKGVTISCIYRDKITGSVLDLFYQPKNAIITYTNLFKFPAQIKEINISKQDSVIIDFGEIKIIAHLNDQNFIILEEAE